MRIVILSAAAISPLALILLWHRAPLAGIAILALSHALLLLPTLVPNLQWLGPVITCFETDSREVWLTIDDGPASDTSELLGVLDRHGAKATFFVKGAAALRDPEAIREIVRRGHGVANHSHTHPSGTFWCLPPSRIADEVALCSMTLQKITGEPSRWFRAPVGMKNPAVHPILRRYGMRLIGWSARGFDAVRDDRRTVLSRIMPRVRPGAIIVMHQGRPWSAVTIDELLAELRKSGYSFVIPSDDRLKTKR